MPNAENALTFQPLPLAAAGGHNALDAQDTAWTGSHLSAPQQALPTKPSRSSECVWLYTMQWSILVWCTAWLTMLLPGHAAGFEAWLAIARVLFSRERPAPKSACAAQVLKIGFHGHGHVKHLGKEVLRRDLAQVCAHADATTGLQVFALHDLDLAVPHLFFAIKLNLCCLNFHMPNQPLETRLIGARVSKFSISEPQGTAMKMNACTLS